jgi:hypothetical protein
MLLLNATVAVYRLTKVGYKDSYPVTPTITGMSVSIVPASEEALKLFPSSTQYAQFQVFTENLDTLKTGDKIINAEDREWILSGVGERYDLGLGLDYQWFMAEQVPL